MGHAQQASATCTVPHLEYDLQASALETDVFTPKKLCRDH